jgi:hypothetical protein
MTTSAASARGSGASTSASAKVIGGVGDGREAAPRGAQRVAEGAGRGEQVVPYAQRAGPPQPHDPLAAFGLPGRGGDQFPDPQDGDGGNADPVLVEDVQAGHAGQAFRARYLDQALAYIAGHPGVWLTTSDEIAEHYARTVPAA